MTNPSSKHPGSILLHEHMTPRGITRSGLARATGIPVHRIREIVAGRRAITIAIATRLAARLGTDVRYWLDLQRDYEREQAKSSVEEGVAKE